MHDCQAERIGYDDLPQTHDGIPLTGPAGSNGFEKDLSLALLEMTLRAYEAEAARDMLARRCADQARQIADLVSPPPAPAGDVFSAIATHQKQGVR